MLKREKLNKELIELTLENHPNCPKCNSSDTYEKTVNGACLCGCDCWGYPICRECGYTGYLNSDKIYWDIKGEL